MSNNTDFHLAAPNAIETALGRQLEALRLSKNMTQSRLAEEAGISRRTVTRLENGGGVSLDTFIRIMTALGVVDNLQTLLPDATVQPIDRVRHQTQQRQRARSQRQSAAAPWQWADESEPT